MNTTTSPEVLEQDFLLYLILVSGHLFFSISSNLVALYVLQKQRQIDDITRLIYQVFFCFNLAMSVSWCTWHLVWFGSNDFEACLIANWILAYPTHVLMFTVMFNICFISAEKYIFISRPLRYHVIFRTTRVKIILLTAFLISCVLCVPYLYSKNLLAYLQSGCMGTVFFFESHAGSVEYGEFLVLGSVSLASFTSVVVNVLIIRIAYVQSRRVDFVQHLHHVQVGREHEPDDVHDSGNVRPPHGRRTNRGIVSTLLLTGSFYAVWILWIVHRFLPPSVKVFSETSGANCGWLQPLSYLVATKEARDILKQWIWK